jgi:DNA-3-methyladenine glycosylase
MSRPEVEESSEARGDPLARSLLAGHAAEVAPGLLGALLVVGGRVGRVVEVEAYGGADDPASHAHRGRSERNASMYAEAGTLYCYRSHGLHVCANVVTGGAGIPQAVLIRAVEPVRGVETMWGLRPRARREVDLTNGPGKLCAALGIQLAHDGTDLCAPAPPVQLLQGGAVTRERVLCSPRVGISRAVDRPWRFLLEGSSFVSRGPRGRPIASSPG